MTTQQPESHMQPGLFLDRDGVLIENRSSYVRSWDDVAFIPYALQAMAQLARISHKIVIVTNQSAVGRGIISLETAQIINHRLMETIKNAGGRVDAIYMCPHAPEELCECRKPKPGLLHQAAQELSIDLIHSTLVGDAITDIQAGASAGVPRLILVRTGRGEDQLAAASVDPHIPAFSTRKDFASFVEEFLA